MEDKLKPCPFCGEPARLIKTNLGWFAECTKYGHIHNSGVFEKQLQPTKEKAIKQWNGMEGQANG